MIKTLLKRTKGLFTKRNKKYIKAVAKETILESKKLGKFAVKEMKKNSPKAKKELKSFSAKIKKIKR